MGYEIEQEYEQDCEALRRCEAVEDQRQRLTNTNDTSRKATWYTCPSCNKDHEIELAQGEEYEDYDGLCLACEADWLMSPEYQSMLRAMGG